MTSLDEAYNKSSLSYENTIQREIKQDYSDHNKFNSGYYNKDGKKKQRQNYFKAYNEEKQSLAERYLVEFNYALRKDLEREIQSNRKPTGEERREQEFQRISQKPLMDYSTIPQAPLKGLHNIDNNGTFSYINGNDEDGTYSDYQDYDIYAVNPEYYNNRGKIYNNNLIERFENINCKSIRDHIQNCNYCSEKYSNKNSLIEGFIDTPLYQVSGLVVMIVLLLFILIVILK